MYLVIQTHKHKFWNRCAHSLRPWTISNPSLALQPHRKVWILKGKGVRAKNVLLSLVCPSPPRPCELEEAKDPPALQEEGGSGSAKGKLAWLEAALQRAKQDVTHQLCEYRELMILKRGLDLRLSPTTSCWRVRRAGDRSSGKCFRRGCGEECRGTGQPPPSSAREGWREMTWVSRDLFL